MLLVSDGTTSCRALFQGELLDDDLGLLDLRSRWLDLQLGRFVSMDTFESPYDRPLSLNKFGFVRGDGGVNLLDPDGFIDIASVSTANGVQSVLASRHDISFYALKIAPSKAAIVHYWEPDFDTRSVGHVSLTLSNGTTHISLFPDRDQSPVLWASPYWVPDLRTDIRLEHNRRPTQEFYFTSLDEKAIMWWLPRYKVQVNGWSLGGTLLGNSLSFLGLKGRVCTSAVADALKVGGLDLGSPTLPQSLALSLGSCGRK